MQTKKAAKEMISAKIEVPVGGKKKALALGVLVAGMMGASFVLAAVVAQSWETSARL
jgi:hypothetical protein